jgi:hypothetical protein
VRVFLSLTHNLQHSDDTKQLLLNKPECISSGLVFSVKSKSNVASSNVTKTAVGGGEDGRRRSCRYKHA